MGTGIESRPPLALASRARRGSRAELGKIAPLAAYFAVSVNIWSLGEGGIQAGDGEIGRGMGREGERVPEGRSERLVRPSTFAPFGSERQGHALILSSVWMMVSRSEHCG